MYIDLEDSSPLLPYGGEFSWTFAGRRTQRKYADEALLVKRTAGVSDLIRNGNVRPSSPLEVTLLFSDWWDV